MSKLPDTIFTPQDITALICEVREYAAWFEHETIKRRTRVTSQSTEPVLSNPAVLFLRSIATNHPLRAQDLDAAIAELEAYKKLAPTVTITLAAPATTCLKQTLTTWCRQELAPNILVSFTHNRALLGGMVVRYGSRTYDWSFRRQLLNTPVQFSEVLHRV